MSERCRCRDCLSGDALPDHLQGWPGAWQMRLFPSSETSTMRLIPTFNDQLRAACQDSCAEFGDPPCYDVEPGCKPCAECLVACGFSPDPEPLDPDAVVARLL